MSLSILTLRECYAAIAKLPITDATVEMRAYVLTAIDDLHDAIVAEEQRATVKEELAFAREESCPPTERNLEHE